MSRDFYLAGIPFTDSAAGETLKGIEKALYNSGLIYKDELKDQEKAKESFKELIDRFPESEFQLAAYYNLYGIARDQNDPAMMEFYKNQIARKFPESMYAKVLTDPEYFEKLERDEKIVRDYYAETYNLYLSGNYFEVTERCRKAAMTYPGHKLTPMFAYLGILANGKTTDKKVFRDSLLSVISRYPGSEIAADARNLVSYMDKDHPEIKEAEEQRISKELYDYSPVAKHYFIFSVNKNINTNQLVFNIINYNLDHLDSLNLIVEVINISNSQNLVSVKSFRNQDQAADYMEGIINTEEVRKDMPDFIAVPFVISEKNLTTLRKDKSVERYLKFYNETYQ
jgi:TolA-binding protein